MTTQTAKQEIPAGTYVADPVHSSIHFAVTHNGVSTFRSGFGAYEARLSGGETPRLEGTVEVASIQIEEPQLKGQGPISPARPASASRSSRPSTAAASGSTGRPSCRAAARCSTTR